MPNSTLKPHHFNHYINQLLSMVYKNILILPNKDTLVQTLTSSVIIENSVDFYEHDVDRGKHTFILENNRIGF